MAAAMLTLELDADVTSLAHIASPRLYTTRIAPIEWTWDNGAKADKAEIELTIVNLALVP